MKKKAIPSDSASSGSPSAILPFKARKKGATAKSPQHEDPSWAVLETQIGGRKGFLDAALASVSPKAAILAELLLDPAQQRTGTKALAKKAGLTMPEIVDLYRDRKWLETTLILHSKLPTIVEGAADDASPKMIPCPDCKGTSKAENGDDCWVCIGTGQIRRAGDKDKLSFVGEATGMTGKRGPLIQTNIQLNTLPQQENSFESLMRKATVNVQAKQIEGVKDAEIVDK